MSESVYAIIAISLLILAVVLICIIHRNEIKKGKNRTDETAFKDASHNNALQNYRIDYSQTEEE